MRVSFAVTVFNKAPFLPRVLAALEAEREAVGGGGEIVLVDDGSADGGDAILARFAAGRGDVTLHRGANAGVAAATNRAAALCRGEFVRLVDADDLLVRGGTAALLAACGAVPGAVAAFGRAGSWNLGDPEPPPLSADAAWGVLRDPLRAALRSQLFVPSALLVRREALLRCLPLDERFRTSQDFALSLRLAREGAALARLDAEVCRMAREAPGRLSGSKARMFAESVAILGAEWEAWSPAHRRYALQRAAGRAALYAGRHLPGGASRALALRALAAAARLPGWNPSEAALGRVARAYAPALADPRRYP